ncbi:MAG: hypothetical protein ACR2OJ_08085 [Hyphomicrobiales bacterium]
MLAKIFTGFFASTLIIFSMVVTATANNDGNWIGVVHEESETEQCEIYIGAPIQAAARSGKLYGWAQIGHSWHKVSGRVTNAGHVTGAISSANALDPETVPSAAPSALRFSMQIEGDLAQGSWSTPDGCNGRITAHRP